MKLLDYTTEDFCLASLEAQDRDTCLQTLSSRLNQGGRIEDPQELYRALLNREKAESTGIGRGIALPHARCEGFQGHAVAIAHLRRPVDFRSADGKAVDLVFLLAGSSRFPGTQLRILARISQLVHNPSFLEGLRKASTPSAILDCLRETENALR